MSVQPTHSAFAPAHHSTVDGQNTGLHHGHNSDAGLNHGHNSGVHDSHYGSPSNGRLGGFGHHEQRATVFLRPIADPGALG